MKYFLAKLKNFYNIELVKTISFIGIAKIISMITGLIVNKILAVKLGPSGFAYIGQFRSFVTIASNASTGGIKDGVVKYVAEFKENKSLLYLFLKTAFTITLITGIITGIVIILFAQYWSNFIFASSNYVLILRFFGVSVAFFALNILCISVINGLREIKSLTKIQICGSILSLVFTGGLCYFYSLYGALIALSILQSLQFFITIYFINKLDVLKKNKLSFGLDRNVIHKLLGFSVLSFFTAFIAPMVDFGVRGYIINSGNLSDAGIWDAMRKLSTLYMSIVGATLPVYFLPKFSELTNAKDIRREIISAYSILLPVTILVFIIIFLCRNLIIHLLFSESFSNMSALFFPKIISDFLQLISLVLVQLIIAKARLKIMAIIQIIFSVLTYLLSIFMYDHYGIIGIIYGNSFKYFLFICVLVFISRDLLFKSKK